MERPRYWRCAHRKHIYILFEFFKLLLMRHAKPLFLINYQKAQIFEFYVLLKQSVRAYYYIYFARFQLFKYLCLLGSCAETRQHLHFYRKIFHS